MIRCRLLLFAIVIVIGSGSVHRDRTKQVKYDKKKKNKDLHRGQEDVYEWTTKVSPVYGVVGL